MQTESLISIDFHKLCNCLNIGDCIHGYICIAFNRTRWLQGCLIKVTVDVFVCMQANIVRWIGDGGRAWGVIKFFSISRSQQPAFPAFTVIICYPSDVTAFAFYGDVLL
ncbi:conserved hypothetical protein [Trichinella spiralis]|uniref:hypothetical protein n=1 Tax=Trichinella spiralis TaxID=6334 RepID=UPI0001EFC9C0|nr:conserved hypothetical protein [Trichinella spiralis]